MATTPRLSFPYIAENQSSAYITVNSGLDLNDALVQCTALDYTNTPPGSPAAGDLYLCGASPTGAWSGHAQALALYSGGAWQFHAPVEGWWCYDRTANTPRYFDGSVWQAFSGGALSAAFTDLTDAPSAYTGQAAKLVRVNATETGLEFYTLAALISTFLGLTDTPSSYSGQGGKTVKVNSGATALEFVDVAAGVDSFLDLSDTPDDYSGDALKTVRVNAAGTALEFAPSEVYDVGVSVPGSPTASQVLVRYPFPRTVYLPAALAGSEGVCGTAATAEAVLSVQKNAVEVGTITFALGASTATFAMASETQFDAGDILTIVAPASPDATLADLGIALAGSRLPLDPIPYDVMASIGGTPDADSVLLRYPFPRAVSFVAGLTASQGVCASAPDAETVFSCQKNGVEFGTMSFAGSATTATFAAASQADFVAGDVLTVVCPADLNSLADLGFALSGFR